jgi:ABC-type glycerol-3-phosphate transport system substrate-binding protein
MAGDAYWTRGILPIIYQNGGDIISPDGTKVSGYLDSDATIEALTWYTDLFLKDKVAPTKPMWMPSTGRICSPPAKRHAVDRHLAAERLQGHEGLNFG